MDLTEYRNSGREKQRIADLTSLLPDGLETALDIGARDGFISRLLAERFSSVTALDLEKPDIDHPRVACVKGDATALEFSDATFDLVFCAEVLEHIPTPLLARACHELSRVSRRFVLIGVPYRQDIRMGRTTCATCGGKSPPWGHVNSFDEQRLQALFPACGVARKSFVGVADPGTNALSALLMDLAGNPYGTYTQEEPCVHCGAALKPLPERNFVQKVFTRAAVYAQKVQKPFMASHANWMHILFDKQGA